MIDFDRLQKAIQTYFPSHTVELTTITNKIYIECSSIFSATLDISRERSVMIETVEIKGFKGMYKNELSEIEDTEKYVFHAITASLIRSRKALYIKRIYCKLKPFRDYLKDMYPRYVASEEVTKTNSIKIELMLTLEAHQFSYFEVIGHIGSLKDPVKYGVENYPIWYIGRFAKKFNYVEIVKEFNPYLQNLYQIKHVVDTCFDEEDRKIMYTNLLSAMELSNVTIDRIIQDNFGGRMSAMLFKHTKSLKRFDNYMAEKYRINELNIWDYIAGMDGVDENYIDTYYVQFKPYFREILKNPELSLEFIKSHRKDIKRTGSFPIVLIFNKNIDREYLIKNRRRYKNAIIHRIALLNSGDEYLFHKYRRRLKWELLKEYYTGQEDVSISQIIEYGKKYLCDDDASILRGTHHSYINQMFTAK